MDPVLAQLGLGLGVDLMVDLWMSLDHHLGLEADLLLDPEIVDLSLEMSAMDWKV